MATLLRNEITSFCATLDPSVDEVLYAAFYGDKPQAARLPSTSIGPSTWADGTTSEANRWSCSLSVH